MRKYQKHDRRNLFVCSKLQRGASFCGRSLCRVPSRVSSKVKPFSIFIFSVAVSWISEHVFKIMCYILHTLRRRNLNVLVASAFVNFVELSDIGLTESISLSEEFVRIINCLNGHLVVRAEMPIPIMHHAVIIVALVIIVSLSMCVLLEVCIS